MSLKHLTDKKRTNKIITASQAHRVIHDRKTLWKEMTGKVPKFQGNEMTDWGNTYEPVAISELENYLQDYVEEGNIFHVHKELPLGASPDGFYEGNPVEVKCPWTQKIYPNIPEKYMWQMQIQMEVLDKPKCIFAVWTPAMFHVEQVQRDKEFIKWYMPFVNEFLDYVKLDNEPKKWNKKPKYNKEKV